MHSFDAFADLSTSAAEESVELKRENGYARGRLSPSGKYLVSLVDNFKNGIDKTGVYWRLATLCKFSATASVNEQKVVVVGRHVKKAQVADELMNSSGLNEPHLDDS